MAIMYSKQERENNRKTCEQCEYKLHVRCSACGCFLRGLQVLKSIGCPKGKF